MKLSSYVNLLDSIELKLTPVIANDLQWTELIERNI